MKSTILLLALMFNCGNALAENNSLFNYDREEVIAALEARYGSVEESEITLDSDTVWVSKGKRTCGFFIEGTNWGIYSKGGSRVVLGYDSAASRGETVLRFMRCYRTR